MPELIQSSRRIPLLPYIKVLVARPSPGVTAIDLRIVGISSGRKDGPCFSSVSGDPVGVLRSEEHTSELQSRGHLVCRLLLEKKSHVADAGSVSYAHAR